MSAPHTYIPTRPFLPSQSRLLTIFVGEGFGKCIEMETGLSWPAAPLEWTGHVDSVNCTSYLPNGCYIITGANNGTIRIWDAETGAAFGEPVIKCTTHTESAVCSPNSSGATSHHNTSHVYDAFPSPAVDVSLYNTTHAALNSRPDAEGWVRATTGGLLYWVPPGCRVGLRSSALLTLPRDSDVRSVSLNFDNFAFGTSWAQIYNNPDL